MSGSKSRSGRAAVAPSDLKVGDCFDVPTLGSTVTVKTVQHHPCTEAHTAEVIDVVDYSGNGTTYPDSTAFDVFVVATCNPAFQAYVGIGVNADRSVDRLLPAHWRTVGRVAIEVSPAMSSGSTAAP